MLDTGIKIYIPKKKVRRCSKSLMMRVHVWILMQVDRWTSRRRCGDTVTQIDDNIQRWTLSTRVDGKQVLQDPIKLG